MIRRGKPALRVEASAASEKMRVRMLEIAAGYPQVPCEVSVKSSHALMQRATAGMVASGTATLEAAYFELPFVLLYRAAWLTFAIGRRLVKVRWLGMPNILAGREVVREFLQEEARPAPIAAEVSRLLDDAATRESFLHGLRGAVAKLGEPGASGRAAEAILAELNLTYAESGSNQHSIHEFPRRYLQPLGPLACGIFFGGSRRGDFLTEAAQTSDDAAHLVVARRKNTFLIMNRYPYAVGHLMAVPYRKVADLADLTEQERRNSGNWRRWPRPCCAKWRTRRASTSG